mmetsp:Transcript_14441/g.21437  ORF Transcript_14441/g.21437 Transcript_14441/m.21437 type:complete len:349 (-) Transcript_14441:36-1082(-)
MLNAKSIFVCSYLLICESFVHHSIKSTSSLSIKNYSARVPLLAKKPSDAEISDVPFVEADVESNEGIDEGDSGIPSDSALLEERPVTTEPQPFSGKVFVAGASGFVGSKVCQSLINDGATVIGLSRSGKPYDNTDPWVDQVVWVKANVFEEENYKSMMEGCESVVSCIGGIGLDDSYLKAVNGDATIKLCEIAKEMEIKRFVFISVYDFKLPDFISKAGYFAGKREAETRIGELFGSEGYILKPALIYGQKKVKFTKPISNEEKTINLNLSTFGEPIENILSQNIFKRIAKSGLPLADTFYTQPINVVEVGYAAAKCASGTATAGVNAKPVSSYGATELDIDDIKRMK